MRSAWIWLAVMATLVLVGGGLVAFTVVSRTPECGAAGEAALRGPAGELQGLLPALEVDSDFHRGDCGLDGTTFAVWSYPSLGALQSDGRAAGCALGDLRSYEDEPMLSCPVASGAVVLLWVEDEDGNEASGSLALK